MGAAGSRRGRGRRRRRRAAAGGSGPGWATRYQSRCSGVPGTGSTVSRPAASSAATASREIRVTPRPTLADSRIAPFEPTIRVSGAMSSSASSVSVPPGCPTRARAAATPAGPASAPGCAARAGGSALAASWGARWWRHRPGSARRPRPAGAGGPRCTSTSQPGSGRPPSTRSTWCRSSRPRTRSRLPGLQPEAQLRVAHPEAAEQPGQDLLGRRGDRGDAQLAPLRVGRGRRGPARLVQQAEDAPDVAGVRLARLGQPQPPAVRLRAAARPATSAARPARPTPPPGSPRAPGRRPGPSRASATARNVRSWFSVTGHGLPWLWHR